MKKLFAVSVVVSVVASIFFFFYREPSIQKSVICKRLLGKENDFRLAKSDFSGQFQTLVYTADGREVTIEVVEPHDRFIFQLDENGNLKWRLHFDTENPPLGPPTKIIIDPKAQNLTWLWRADEMIALPDLGPKPVPVRVKALPPTHETSIQVQIEADKLIYECTLSEQ